MLCKKDWVEKQWPSIMFMDPRLRKRAVKIGEAFLNYPDRSIPKRFPKWGDVKGCYRFFSRPEMDHHTLQAPHYQNTFEEASQSPGKVLFIQDGSELIYNSHPWTSGLGPTGDSCGNGIMFHSCLAVKIEEETPKVIGLACQKAWIRDDDEDKASEGDVWQEMIERIGEVPATCEWISVGDRASDIFPYVRTLSTMGWGCVIRTKHDRKILVGGEVKKLKSYMRSLPSMASCVHEIRAKPGAPKREITLQISWVEAEVLSPEAEKEKTSIKGSYVRVWCAEDHDIEWILFTLSRVATPEEALGIVKIYTLRWIIEEYHKCLKTGCKVEESQLREAGRLLGLFGMLGVIATQLLQLRDISRLKQGEPAEKHVEKIAVKIVQKFYKLQVELTVKEFWRRVAMLGGFLGRKSDGDPGWQTIWYGWLRLQDMMRGAMLAGYESEIMI